MNVAEWARFEGSPVGGSMHWIDSGIDTGVPLQSLQNDVRGPENSGG
jgi:hypothetical protein